MAIGPDHKAAFVAFSRFSFGARGGAYAGDLARAASDPRGFLKAELLKPGIARLDAASLPDTRTALSAVFADQEQKRQERARAGAPAKEAPSPSQGADKGPMSS